MTDSAGHPSSSPNASAALGPNGCIYVFEDFELHTQTCELFRSGGSAGLQLKPTRLLLYLIEHRDRTVPKEELLHAIWRDTYVSESAFTSAVRHIRHALDDDGDSQRLIRTFRGRGYRFVAPVERKAVPSPPEDAVDESRAEPGRSTEARRTRLHWAVGALLLLSAALVSWYRATDTPPNSERALAFEERDWVLISSFENKTGETLFEGTLEHALELTLANSRFVNVVPRARIEDTLRLMKQPADARVDVSLGREIALRDGAIRALLAGRIEKLGPTYVLSVQIVNALHGATMASLSEAAQGQAQVWLAIRRLAADVRATLGENLSSIRQSQGKLAKVTTPSLRALQLYSQADALMLEGVQGGQTAAAGLLKQALVEDPTFASAHIHLAWTTWNRGGAKDEYLAQSERALELAETTTERERDFIEGSYHTMRGEHEKARASYKALLQFYPDHYWATKNLSSLYGRGEESMPYLLRMAELRPNAFDANVEAAQALVRENDLRERAEPYLQRARALLSLETEKRFPYHAAWLRLFPAHEHWIQGNVIKALQEVTRLDESAKTRSGRERYILGYWIAATYLALGKLRAAEEIYLSFPDSPRRHNQLGIVALARGDEAAAMKHLPRAWPTLMKVSRLAHAGLFEEAEQARQAMLGLQLSRMFPLCAAAKDKIARATVALARGETAAAVGLLETAKGEARHASQCSFDPSPFLAQALEQQGERPRALRVREEAVLQRNTIFAPMTGIMGHFWIGSEWQRATLLRELGRVPEAREIEDELRKLLAYADDDHDIARELRNIRKEQMSTLPKAKGS